MATVPVEKSAYRAEPNPLYKGIGIGAVVGLLVGYFLAQPSVNIDALKQERDKAVVAAQKAEESAKEMTYKVTNLEATKGTLTTENAELRAKIMLLQEEQSKAAEAKASKGKKR